MKPSAFEYHRPSTVEEAVDLLADLSEAELMAGNQSLSIIMSNRLANPDHIIDINGIDELQYIDTDGDAVEVGALSRHRELETSEALREALPMLPEAAEQIAGPVVRNRGTIGGSIGEADPAGNYPCVLTALDGELEIASSEGRRTVGADEYFVAYMLTDIEEDELITAVRFPRDAFPTSRTGMAFLGQKQAAQTWPTLSVASSVRVDDPAADVPVVEDARIGLANAADTPLCIEAIEDELAGEPLTEAALDTVGEMAYEEVRPQDEMHADEQYKRELAREYTKRAVEEAHTRANA